MGEKHTVVVSRNWQNPAISIDVTRHGIEIGMGLESFLSAVVEELGNPSLIVTKAQLLAKLKSAAEVVTESMKSETTRAL